MDKHGRQLLALLLACALLAGSVGCTRRGNRSPEPEEPEEIIQEEAPSVEEMSEEELFGYVTGHVAFPAAATLSVNRPGQDVTTSLSTYYITGAAHPDRELRLNGEPVESRGSLGSFGVFVELEEGENVFTFRQENREETVVITRAGEPRELATVSDISRMFPTYDQAVWAGEEVELRCEAPSGSSVIARVGGQTVDLFQSAATAQAGIAAVFTGSFVPDDVPATQSIGPVEYLLDDGSSFTSAGELYVSGSGASLVVEAADVSSVVFGADGGYRTTAREGAVDRVLQISGDSYLLSMGGWIYKEWARPLEGAVDHRNRVELVEVQAAERGEEFLFHGTAHPVHEAELTADDLTITFYNTTGVGAVPTIGQGLIADVDVREEDGDTILTLTAATPGTLWGYDVEYNNGVTLLYCREKPTLAHSERPLEGVRILLDPGHGGEDEGAPGLSGGGAVAEAEVNYATAVAVARRLELLGAEVLFTRESGEGPSLNDRLATTRGLRPDLFLSLHANSIDASADGTGPSGVEVYYYEDTARSLAEALERNITRYCGRTSRGARQSYYKVTLSTVAPAVLIEMGFLTSPTEYDDLRSREGIYNTAQAVENAVLALLS